MKNLIRRWILRRQIRSIAAHLNALDRERDHVERSTLHYERLCRDKHTQLLRLQLGRASHA
jgi:hypothetical protein